MLDLSLTTSVYFPAFVGFFMLIGEAWSHGACDPRHRENGGRDDGGDDHGEQDCNGALSHDPPSRLRCVPRG